MWQEKKRHQTLEIKFCQEDIRKTNDMKKIMGETG